MTINHPYPGPQYTEFAGGSFTISTAGTAGPNVQGGYFLFCMDDSTTTAYVVGSGDTSVTKGAKLTGQNQYIPVRDLQSLMFRGSANSVTVNYTVGR